MKFLNIEWLKRNMAKNRKKVVSILSKSKFWIKICSVLKFRGNSYVILYFLLFVCFLLFQNIEFGKMVHQAYVAVPTSAS